MIFSSTSRTVLIVDDTPQNIHILMEAMEDGCRVLVAKSGEEALHKALQEKPAL